MSTITISLSDNRLEELRDLSNRSNLTVEEFVRDVLDDLLARTRSQQVKGVHGKTLMRFVGAIPEDDLAIMSEAIETECGKIDWDEW